MLACRYSHGTRRRPDVDDAFYPPGRPGFTPQYAELYRSQAAELVAAFPLAAYDLGALRKVNFTQWSREGYELALRHGYLVNATDGAPPLRCQKNKPLVLPKVVWSADVDRRLRR